MLVNIQTVFRNGAVFEKNFIIKLSVRINMDQKQFYAGSIEKHRNRALADTQRHFYHARIAAWYCFHLEIGLATIDRRTQLRIRN